MTKGWIGVALLAGWLGVSASAYAQPNPASPAPVGPGNPGAPGAAGAPAPGHDPGPPPPYPATGLWPGQEAPAESLPPNAFSNVHPEQVGPSPCVYLGVDYLHWWIRKRQVPPLVTLGSVNDTVPGAGGQPGTINFIGQGTLDVGDQSGVRLNAVVWFDQDHTFGIDGSAFWFPDVSEKRIIAGFGGSNSLAVLARPFFNVNSGQQDADPIVFPGVQAGAMTVTMPRQFWGADADLRYSACVDCGPITRWSLLAGARYLLLNEKLLIAETVFDLPDIFGTPGNTTALQDNFVTSNRFYGGQLGVETESRVGPVVVTTTAKVAVGRTYETITVNGATLLTLPTGEQFFDPRRGLLVQPTNIGRFHRHQLAVAPEFDMNLAWDFNEHFRASLGYTFLYWSKVVRPGDQIDREVNVGAIGAPTQFGTSPHPIMPFNTTGFWAQGLTAGLEVSF
jgi:hypothetical protein